QNPPINFVLNEVAYTKGGTLSHLGIQVESTDDVLKTRERWVESGLLTVDEMQVDCCYALQDKTWARDPDGNEWEVFVVLENTEPVANACACGDKVSHAELAESNQLSTSACCTPSQKATTIAATNSPCC
ncbi:MAG: VOC family protein, partial [Pyrinomonadaceae bacterium]